MGLQTHHIVAVQQPVQLLTRQGDHSIFNIPRPLKARPLQALLPQTEAVAFPVQDLELVVPAVAEHEQLFGITAYETAEPSWTLGAVLCEEVDCLSEIEKLECRWLDSGCL